MQHDDVQHEDGQHDDAAPAPGQEGTGVPIPPPPHTTAGPPAQAVIIDELPSQALREPGLQVSPRAVNYWRLNSLLGLLFLLGIMVTVYLLVWDAKPWWTTAAIVAVAVLGVVHLIFMPIIRFRVHRWEVTPTAVYARSGWLNREQRIAPLSRVQTVDSTRGALMRLFGISSITVTTASAAGPITIEGLDKDIAEQVVAELTEITGVTEGDAT